MSPLIQLSYIFIVEYIFLMLAPHRGALLSYSYRQYLSAMFSQSLYYMNKVPFHFGLGSSRAIFSVFVPWFFLRFFASFSLLCFCDLIHVEVEFAKKIEVLIFFEESTGCKPGPPRHCERALSIRRRQPPHFYRNAEDHTRGAFQWKIHNFFTFGHLFIRFK